MAFKKNFLKISGLFLFLLVLYTLGQYAFDRFIRRELPKIIAEKNHTPYEFTYTGINYSLALRKLTLEGLSIKPKKDSLIINETKLDGTVSSIEIQGVEIWTLLKEHRLKANYITLNKPTLTLWKAKRDSLQSKKSVQKTSEIDLTQINIIQGKLQFIDRKTQQTNTSLDNVNIAIQEVKFDTTDDHQGLPFTYEKLNIQWDTMYHLIDEKRYLTTQETKLTKHQLDIQHFKVYANDSITINGREPMLWIPDLHLTGIQLALEDQIKLAIDEVKATTVKLTIPSSTKEQPKTNSIIKKNTKPKNNPIEIAIHHVAIDSIEAKKDNIWALNNLNVSLKEFRKTSTDTIHIQSLKTQGGWIQLQANNKKKTTNAVISNKQTLDLPDITIDSINTTNTRLSLRNNKKEILEVEDINTTFRNLTINGLSVRKQIPFTFTSTYLKANRITYRTNKHYELKIESLIKDNQQLSLTEFSYLPTLSRQGMVKTFKYADDIFWIKAKSVKITDYELNWDRGKPLFYAKKLIANQVNANILRDKTPPHNMSNKPLFSKKLRDLKLGISIDQTLIKNSLLTYEETSPKAIAPGKLTFGQFNATINHLVSGYNKKQVPSTTIAVDAQFMNAAPLHVDWSFNVMNKADNFRIKGNIKDFPAGAMQPFLQPYIKASTEGSIDVVTFDFKGNAQSATGNFGIKYHDLRVSLYRKNGKVKRRTLSAIGNLIIHNNSKGEVKNVAIKEVQKVEEKSFFNYLWLCILQGLRQTIL
ncbi:AsmA family protein [Myroides pelagicus]|uniref:DUF748 domain-containing protein n=1 Tax=Myroides pelagicus TaxID=270914 RepID=A0A7K1GJ67_9FLAO|nr:DUF748 domain-containing protein [Myroides pelagicus]MEC4112512.1 DUF748 domain-containing protein [Myroides pelagicus]MTH28569.1 DUF748 domain-containing protein [Myroides pelagicus]